MCIYRWVASGIDRTSSWLACERHAPDHLLDSFGAILDHAAQCGWRIFYLGSSPKVSRTALPLLRAAHPGLVLSGHHGFLTTRLQSDAVIDKSMFSSRTSFSSAWECLFKEIWLSEHWARSMLGNLTSGATLDYVTGHAYRPPMWAGLTGAVWCVPIVFRSQAVGAALPRRADLLTHVPVRRLAWSRLFQE